MAQRAKYGQIAYVRLKWHVFFGNNDDLLQVLQQNGLSPIGLKNQQNGFFDSMTWVFELKDEREIISPIITLRWRMETADLDSIYRLFGLRPTVRHAVYSTYDDIHEW